ncbi:MAG: hypothetical protein PVI43_07675, partial [Candidatus Bathyarchaeota archaeon]
EYQIIPEAQKDGTLKHVDRVIMEIHGPKRPITKLLNEAGFRITHERIYHPELRVIAATKNLGLSK